MDTEQRVFSELDADNGASFAAKLARKRARMAERNTNTVVALERAPPVVEPVVDDEEEITERPVPPNDGRTTAGWKLLEVCKAKWPQLDNEKLCRTVANHSRNLSAGQVHRVLFDDDGNVETVRAVAGALGIKLVVRGFHYKTKMRTTDIAALSGLNPATALRVIQCLCGAFSTTMGLRIRSVQSVLNALGGEVIIERP